ncbi:MAG: hypothetical protein ACK5F1_02845 [Burkholderiales bacterium]|jgi:hypothetical protein|nr:hypothetical protein [Betaproteobacteria bacterium]
MTRGVIIFWAIFVLVIGIDYRLTDRPRLEPKPFALGSGEASSSGHCSGK